MGIENFSSTETGTETKFVQAIEDLMKSLPENVASRVPNHKDGKDNVHVHQDETLHSKEKKPSHCNNDSSIPTSGTSQKFPKIDKHLKEDLHVSSSLTKEIQEYVMMGNEKLPINNNTNDTYYMLTDVISPHQSRDFSFKSMENDDCGSIKKKVDELGIKTKPKANVQFQGLTDKNGDILIEDALITLDGDYGNFQKIVYKSDQKSKVSLDKPDIEEMSSKKFKLANFPKIHAGDGDCFIVSNHDEEKRGKFADGDLKTLKMSPEHFEQASAIKFSSKYEKPLKTHWALTRITCYNDAFTYEVMKPFKKAPKKLPEETDKVFIVLRERGK